MNPNVLSNIQSLIVEFKNKTLNVSEHSPQYDLYKNLIFVLENLYYAGNISYTPLEIYNLNSQVKDIRDVNFKTDELVCKLMTALESNSKTIIELRDRIEVLEKS